jgi:hypothetical protein
MKPTNRYQVVTKEFVEKEIEKLTSMFGDCPNNVIELVRAAARQLIASLAAADRGDYEKSVRDDFLMQQHLVAAQYWCEKNAKQLKSKTLAAQAGSASALRKANAKGQAGRLRELSTSLATLADELEAEGQ